MEYYSKILSNKLYKGAPLLNFQLVTYLDNDNRILPLGEMDVAINEYAQYVRERNESNCYRFSGKLKGLFTNILFNVKGDRSYENVLALSGNTGEFNPNRVIFQNFGYGDILLEKDGWFFYRENTSGTLKGCVDVFLRPVPNDFYFLPEPLSGLTMFNPNGGTRQNWYFKLTYPKYTADTTIYFQSPFMQPADPAGIVYLRDGLMVEEITGGTLNGREYTYIKSKIKHGLIKLDRIVLRPVVPGINEQVFNVLEVEDDYTFWIDFYNEDIASNVIGNSVSLGEPLRFKRVVLGIESQYMARTFEAITGLKDYQLYKAAFSTNIFNDPIQLYHFNLDVDASLYKDYLGRPLTEVYLTKIKYINPNSFINDMEEWTKLGVGLLLDYNCYDNFSIRILKGGTTKFPYPPYPALIEIVDENNTKFFGDIIDYNVADITERILEVPYYRFNSVNREDNCYPEGYFYRAHDKIILKEYSSQVEVENLTLPDVGIPDYAVMVDGALQWRDLLTPGFFDGAGNGVDYPFLNGCHYIYTDHELCLYRQNPKQLPICFQCTATTTPTPPPPSATTRPVVPLQEVGYFCYGNCGITSCNQGALICGGGQQTTVLGCPNDIGYVGVGVWNGCRPANSNRDKVFIIPGQNPLTFPNAGYFFYTAWGTPLLSAGFASPPVIAIPPTLPPVFPNAVTQSSYYVYDSNTNKYVSVPLGVCNPLVCPPPFI